MRKRRGFALLLALSLAVSSNGMTVLAAPGGTDVQTEQGQESSKLTEAQKLAAQKRQEADAAKQLADEKQQAVKDAEAAAKEAQEKWTKAEADLNALKNPSGTEGTTVTEEQKEKAKQAVQDAGKTVGEKSTAVSEKGSALQKAKDALKALPEMEGVDESQLTELGTEDSDDVKAAKKAVTDAQTALEQAQAELKKAKEDLTAAEQVLADLGKPQQPADADAVKEAEDAVEAAKTKKDEADEALTKAQEAYEAAKKTADDAETAAVEAEEAAKREVSFTDDTGKKVTYDANAANEYIYEVENGVLKSVKKAVTGEGGSTVTVPVEFEGNIVLKQPEGESDKYTSVAAGVFENNQKVTYVQLPAGVTTVAEGGFRGCTALESVSLPSTLLKIERSAFENCTAMTQISVPKTVTEIGYGAFKNDRKLRLVHIDDASYSALTSIGAYAFEDCSVLAEFGSDVGFVLPDKLETLGEGAFRSCRSIKTVNMSKTKIKTVGARAFEGCTGMTDLTVGKNLILIDQKAFYGCTALVAVHFANTGNLTVGKYAFDGCIGLKQLTLPQSVTALGDGAFQNCTRLTRVEVQYNDIQLEGEPFPTNAEGLIIVAAENSNAYIYAVKHQIQTPDKDAFYQYTVEDVDGGLVKDGKFPGGTLWVGLAEGNEYTKNINTLNSKKGVKGGEKCYVYYSQTQEQKGDSKYPETGYTFIPESLRCNGEPIKSEKGKYCFEMPVGGAVITAEFRKNSVDKIKGQKVTVEFSTGKPIQDGKKDDIGYLGVALKVGQNSRMYLMNEEGEPISATQIKFSSKNTKIATVNANGIITAVGTGGADSADTVISAKLVGGDGKEITVNRTISVTAVEADHIYLQASGYNEALIDIEGDKEGIQSAAILKNLVNTQTLSFELKAKVYDDNNDSMSRELTWTSSDSKVAVLAKAKTEAKDPKNVITVQKGCEGESTITVTAKNSSNAAEGREEITQKFVIRVYQMGYRLTSSAVTVNPNSGESGMIELISAYGYGLDDIKSGSLVLYEKDSMGTSRFTAEYVDSDSKSCKKFRIKPDVSTISNGTYEVRVGINGKKGAKDLLPLTITVKRSMPNPTVKFNTTKTKFNLFYKNGGTDADGAQTVVTAEVTKLGDDKIRGFALEPLSNKKDDTAFTDNFIIEDTPENRSKGRTVIRRSGKDLQYTSKNKPAVTGYLVIYYEGYGDSAAKKVKVTMPTCTTAPSLALRETKAVYRAGSGQQNELLEVYDKKSKTREKVALDGNYSVKETAQDIALSGAPEIRDGAIALSFVPEKGKMKLVLSNSNWEVDKNGNTRTVSFDFNVNVSNKKPTFKSKAVTLNLNYPDAEAPFALTSDVKGIDISGTQTFTPVVTKGNAAQISKINVTYTNGEGVAKIAPGQTVKKGTYKFTCIPQTEWPDVKKVTLTVKVVDAKPTVKFGKGSLTLNTVALRNNNLAKVDVDSRLVYRETSEISFKINGMPEGYTLADVGTGDQNTKIVCTTKGKLGAEEKFDFYVKAGNPEEKTDHILGVSLKDSSVERGSYSFLLTPGLCKEGMTTVSAAPVKVKVKVYSSSDISLNVAAKGKINLVNREGEASDKNGIIYTPTLKNLSGEIEEVRIYDAGSLAEESKYFDIEMITEGENKGKFYVTPKKTVKKQETALPENGQTGTPVEYEYAQLEYNKNYPVRIWVRVSGYAGTAETKEGVLSKTLKVKASQILPKVTVNKKVLDVYLASKDYDATFIVRPQGDAAGAIETVVFGEKDKQAKESFELKTQAQADGSLKVIVHLKEGLEYRNGSTNDVKMYVKYKGQGEKTPESATAINMKIRIN